MTADYLIRKKKNGTQRQRNVIIKVLNEIEVNLGFCTE